MAFTVLVDQWMSRPALRVLLVAGYVIFAFLVAVLFPDTPDEVLRIQTAETIREAGYYNRFFWPPGNVLAILANPLVGSGVLGDVIAVRLLNLGVALIPLCFLMFRVQNNMVFLATLLVAPYAFLVLSTGSQQGLMIGLFALLIWAIAKQRLVVLGLAATLLFLVNPAMILALPLTLLFLTRDAWFRRAFLVACLAYLPILVAALLVRAETGHFMPTLAENGPVNIFLGNNPDPMSHRGVGSLTDTLALYQVTDGGYLDAVFAYLKNEPGAFIGNLLTKAGLYWMPWDFLRSGMGEGVSTVIFIYIGFAQLVIYGTFLFFVRALPVKLIIFSVLFCLAAWGLYTLFFVKVRFRVPFDFLLLITCLVAFQPRMSDKNA